MTGGTVVDQSDIAADSVVTTVLVGPSVRGTFEGGSQVREISAGDVVVIPLVCSTGGVTSRIT